MQTSHWPPTNYRKYWRRPMEAPRAFADYRLFVIKLACFVSAYNDLIELICEIAYLINVMIYGGSVDLSIMPLQYTDYVKIPINVTKCAYNCSRGQLVRLTYANKFIYRFIILSLAIHTELFEFNNNYCSLKRSTVLLQYDII